MVPIKRRVIQIANSTQLVSLPRKWAQKYNIRKGDELEVLEQGDKVTFSTDKGLNLSSVEVDVTGLDRSSIMYYIRSVYRLGYDEIKVSFKEPVTVHYRTDSKISVMTVIHTEVNRLVGVEVIEQQENSCIIKDLSQNPANEFEGVLRRVFLLVNDATKDLVQGIRKGDVMTVKSLEEKHDTITKFISYCLRLLNKRGHQEPRKVPYLYHIIASLDRLTDVIKYCARDFTESQPKLGRDEVAVMEKIEGAMALYADFFYKFDLMKVTELYKTRDKILTSIKRISAKKNQSCDKLVILTSFEQVLEILVDLSEARMALEH